MVAANFLTSPSEVYAHIADPVACSGRSREILRNNGAKFMPFDEDFFKKVFYYIDGEL
jgi:hypothetical protein